MILSDYLLWGLLFLEFVARLYLEIRERRATQLRGGLFAVLRLIPLVNDIVPLPENRKEPLEGQFVKMHEEGHAAFRHGVLRNLSKVVLLMLAVWLFAFLLASYGMPLYKAVLWLHLAAVPFRIVFHLYCWHQEYEADRYAFDKLGKKVAKAAMRNLAEAEIPYTRLFAVVYREHPTVAIRSQKILNKVISAD
ncbi:M48 family metalloprotease [uncultured Fibrobacter sp.]|uniref:M48 family metalloprotease n=1 Tax=uncultured Fibrobacter sp. TaxID=261512 RepID=UPI002608AF66|nr:M48 family metalloprotease [uncultured Fibrobacter sp.]